MISYSLTKAGQTQVKLEGKVIGSIRLSARGWQYFPYGQRKGGQIFRTLRECKESLEGE